MTKNRGFSLIELMIAMVLGIVIVGGCLSIFSGVVRSSSVNQTISNIQNSARFALGLIGKDIRAAGFIGCSSDRNVALNVTVSNPPTNNLSSSALTGYVVGQNGNWAPALPAAYTIPKGVGVPVAGTHALSVQYAEYPGLVLESSMDSNSGAVVFERDDDTELQTDQLIVLSDCSSADLFQISSITKNADTVTVIPEETLAKDYNIPAGFPDNTRGFPFVSTIYYIGDTGRTSEAGDVVHALYAHAYPYTAANPPVELVEGADQLVLEFGVRQSDGSMRYVEPGGAGYRVVGIETVRVGLLLNSLERFANVDDSRGYVLAGRTVAASDTAAAGPVANILTYTRDKRMRMPFNATFNVRNRNL